MLTQRVSLKGAIDTFTLWKNAVNAPNSYVGYIL